MRALVITTVVGAAVALAGCQTTGNNLGGVEYDKAALGTLIGAAAGYGISKSSANSSRQNNRAAAIGAILGGASGLYLDQKEKKLRQQMAGTGVEVNRNPDGSVGLVMPGNITFDTNKSNIKPNFYSTLNKVAQTLSEDNKSAILVTGYTDNTGNDSINIPLSQARAQSVANYLSGQGVSSSRINAQGYGSSNPIASNATAQGREQNRRVEISIYERQ
ncbi:outer membrane protein OmpA-like peptidoglycan-associated protein [Acinetobacter baylyi]|uniref:Outer membrane protein OmpA-like peptidoglycan-associated protein n=1 Tax=Acinetobacter baylyi TaxID=202950 RepID=A0ABU0UUX5_ACIBI|nr:OmpA family protein [Acinetobacter baylyi]MDQ1208350.1 outer membrane protein OmpA-like peptidoglycan-associated protein [Acinetobacter baylyi]MDR6108060.1 outer membrane protein OmpA-like peptidoglycan-associated protein [Acinetobacter baylyi]MDR6185224.1 outer membrane protein OmpA-like peptidoglycan-associated protein [Acinetobacter baylyi]